MAIPPTFGLATMHWQQDFGLTDLTVTCGFENSAGDISDVDGIAETIESYWIAGDSPCHPLQMTTGWVFTGVSVLVNQADVLYAGQSYSVTAGTVTDTNSAVPAYSPACVSKYTALSGVPFRGRFYPPFTVSDAERVSPTGAIDTFYLAQMRTTWSNLHVEWSSGGYPPYLLHNARESGVTPNPTPITSFFVQPAVATQRRRKIRA